MASPTPGGASISARYWYDGDGTMVKSNVDGVVTYYAGRHYHKELSDTIETVRKFYTAGNVQVAMRTNGVLTWVLSDHLGSASVTADESGVKLSETHYTAFGEVRLAIGETETPYKYTGQLSQMEEIGLYYYLARWYDPVIAHFGSADSIIPEAGKAAAFDRYAYVNNNPIKYNDPTGHDPVPPPYPLIKDAINFFESVGWSLIGNPSNKSLSANGADQVYLRAVVQGGIEKIEVLAVELKNTATVNLGTLGKSVLGDNYGGSLGRVVRSAERLVRSSNEQLKLESRTIMNAMGSGNLRNALFTSANTISKGAMEQFNYVYQTSREGVVNTIKDLSSNPAAQQIGVALTTLGKSLISAPIIIIPRNMLDFRKWIPNRQTIPT